MSPRTSKLENLIDVAQETSSDKRRELLEGVADLFLDGGPVLNEQEAEIAADILGRVATEVEREVRARLSNRLADLDNAPVALIRQLANDDIQVARPLLERNGGLSDQDLIDIVNKHGKDHQLSISIRSEVSAKVADALVTKGDDEVVLSLVSNDHAKISRGAMESIVGRSESGAALWEPLLSRKDLPPDLMHDMFWWVSAALKRQIMTDADIDEKLVDQMLVEAERGMMGANEEDEESLNRVERTVRRRMRLGQLNQDSLVQYLRRGQVPEFIAALGYLTDIDQKTARRIVLNPGHEAVAVACRAKRFDLSTFSTIVLLLEGATEGGSSEISATGAVKKQLRRPEEVATLLDLYNQIPIENAQRAMRFWAIRNQPQADVETTAKAAPPTPSNGFAPPPERI
ncbi:MAG: DUF2336 domain-containing protein [Proteobacteria bacterium]|nr:DUF2336 domain-containing protein [Pseudomonadota bacterium]